jgi:hypothetical protein
MKSNNATQKTPRGTVILRVLLPVLVLSVLCVRSARADGWSAGSVVTYDESEWGDPSQPAQALLEANFDSVYASNGGVFLIGENTGYFLAFTGAEFLADYLPAEGVPGTLDSDLVNPTITSAGTFGGFVAALKLDTDFSNAGLLSHPPGLPLGDLVLTGFSGNESSLNGLTVEQFLLLDEATLAGQSTSIGVSDMTLVTGGITVAFDDGQPTSFAQDHLIAPGSFAAMPEPSTLPLLMIGIFIVAFVAKKRVLA